MQQELFGTGLNESSWINLLSEIVSMICVSDLKKMNELRQPLQLLEERNYLQILEAEHVMDQAANLHRLFWLIHY